MKLYLQVLSILDYIICRESIIQKIYIESIHKLCLQQSLCIKHYLRHGDQSYIQEYQYVPQAKDNYLNFKPGKDSFILNMNIPCVTNFYLPQYVIQVINSTCFLFLILLQIRVESLPINFFRFPNNISLSYLNIAWLCNCIVVFLTKTHLDPIGKSLILRKLFGQIYLGILDMFCNYL